MTSLWRVLDQEENSHTCFRTSMTMPAVRCLSSKGRKIIKHVTSRFRNQGCCLRGTHREKRGLEMTRNDSAILAQRTDFLKHVRIAMPKSDYSSISHERAMQKPHRCKWATSASHLCTGQLHSSPNTAPIATRICFCNKGGVEPIWDPQEVKCEARHLAILRESSVSTATNRLELA